MNSALLARLVSLMMTLLLISGCSTPEGRKREVEKKINTIKTQPVLPVESIPDFKTPETMHYTANKMRSPFNAPVSQNRLTIGQPDQNRRKQELEVFQLDSLKMVGSLHRQQQIWALILAPNGTLYRVTLGNYLGKNYGKITRITDDVMQLEETIPDGIGGWKKRQVEVMLDIGGQNK